jgi:hypothetical protein
MANTVVWNKHDYHVNLRRRLNIMTNWQDVMDVQYSNDRTIVFGDFTVEPSVVTGTRGTAYQYEDFTIAQDTLTINNFRNIPMFIDEADRLQQTYVSQMRIADFQGKKVNEYLEGQMLAQHTSWVDFGAGDLANTSTDDATTITVSSSNIDDLWRAIKRKINTNNGTELALERGIFIIWRPEDWELLEGYAQANGFTEADIALKNGIPIQRGFYYGGVTHLLSTQHTAKHLFAGVKKTGHLGILKGTYGRAKFLEDPPADTSGSKGSALSGLGIVSRVDYGWQFPDATTPATQRLMELLIDVNVS